MRPDLSRGGRRVAVVGSGIAGLAAASELSGSAQVTLFEAGARFGGHSHTVDVSLAGPAGLESGGVDTGFLVFNHRTYPKLVRLFERLSVETAASEMSFSVQVPDAGRGGLEWSGCDLNTVFAQRSNLARPRFWRMLRDLMRFNRSATRLAEHGAEAALRQPIGDFLAEQGYSPEFRDWYFLPMIGCIWSCPTDQMLRFPVATMIRFCHNHGLLQVANRPQWHTVRGGSKHYVAKLVAGLSDARTNSRVTQVRRAADGVRVHSEAGGTEHFDAVVLACHSDQALGLLADPSPEEIRVLGAVRYHANRAVLHTDTGLLPRRKLAWAAWNYERARADARERSAVCLHYLINRLQPLPFSREVIVSLNPVRAPKPAQVIGEYDYAHPVFDAAAIEAQSRLPALQGVQRTWYCGAWTGYGFHEDGLRSGLDAACAVQRSLDDCADGSARRAA